VLGLVGQIAFGLFPLVKYLRITTSLKLIS